MAPGSDDMKSALLASADIEAALPGEVEVCDLSYMVPGGGKKASPRSVLSGVTAKFPPGRLSAIMGASGSGKTSLLTLIRGLSSSHSKIQGQVSCNGMAVHMERMRSIMSVVPQEDVFLSALTLRETLEFTAELRLPPKWTAQDRSSRVDQVISMLKLEPCSDTRIGDEKQGLRGISGGERRRLSVATAIIGGLPQVLLCDEPTSGLDSAAATNMVSILKGIADRGVTVLCAIHQPSYQVLKEFSHLLLLQAGHMVYFGEVGGAEAYFKEAGSPTPAHTNPAHHYIAEIQEREEFWAGRWKQIAPQTPQDGKALPAAAPGRADQGQGKSKLTMWQQTLVLSRRTLTENFKNKKKFFRGIMSRLPASIMIGFFFWRTAVAPTQQSIFTLKGVIFVAIQNPLIETFYAGATNFQLTKGLLKREYYDGLYQVAPYYLSYYFGFLAMQIPWTFVWVMPMYILVGLPLDFTHLSVFLIATFLVILMACAAGSAVGTRTKDADGNRAVLGPMMIPMILFSGYVIPYTQIPNIWKPVYFLSPVQWGMTILETNHYRGLTFEDCDPSVPAARRRCFATGDEYLEATSNELAPRLGLTGMLLIMIAYLVLFLVLNVRMIRTAVLDGRV